LTDRCYRQSGRQTGRQINVIDRRAGRQVDREMLKTRRQTDR
jgi:hypothetical protein